MAENNAVLTQQAGGEHQICRRGVGINGQRLRLELGIHIGERDSAPVLRVTSLYASDGYTNNLSPGLPSAAKNIHHLAKAAVAYGFEGGSGGS